MEKIIFRTGKTKNAPKNTKKTLEFFRMVRHKEI